MSLELVQKALIAALQTAFPAWMATRVEWENVAFTPPAALSWFSVAFMPVEENVATLGPQGSDLAQGLFQVTLSCPLGIGESNTRQTINELRACYKPGNLINGGQVVTVLSRTRANARIKNNFFTIPFTVRWKAQLIRN
jgi:hypothetical protein